MPKKNNTPRPRLTRDVYSTIERVAEITGNPDAFPEAADLITDILLKMSSRTQVWIDHPDIIRAFLLTVARLGTDDAVTHFSELREACHFAGSGAAIKDLRAPPLPRHPRRRRPAGDTRGSWRPASQRRAPRRVARLAPAPHPKPSLCREGVARRRTGRARSLGLRARPSTHDHQPRGEDRESR